jgi:iron-sulfur cluster assembly protein
MSAKHPISLTDAARAALKDLLEQRSAIGVRIKLRARGCSGLSYVLEYVDQVVPGEDTIPISQSENLYIHAAAFMFLVGTEMDFQASDTRSGFVFRNPQEKGQCGCGSSFYV